ncbi:hypothetical protein C0991_000598 [Blastosporella zonata]|nr:hypothetical protein C0991_000598 [Blastosporella zonata]
MEGGQEETAAGTPADDLIVNEPHSADVDTAVTAPISTPIPSPNGDAISRGANIDNAAASADMVTDSKGQHAMCAVSSPGGSSIPALVDYPASPSSPGTPGTPEPPSPLLVIILPTLQTTEGATLQVPVPLARPQSRSPIPASPKLGSDRYPLHNTQSQG